MLKIFRNKKLMFDSIKNTESLHCTPETNIPQLYLNFYGKFCIYGFFFNHKKKNSFQIRELKSRNPLRDGNLDQNAWAT